jgi:hypothetical protein
MIHGDALADNELNTTSRPRSVVIGKTPWRMSVNAPAALHTRHDESVLQIERSDPQGIKQRRQVCR